MWMLEQNLIMELEVPMCRESHGTHLPFPSPPHYFLFHYIGKVSYIHFRLQKAYMTWWYYGVSNGCKKGFWVHLVTQQSSTMRSLNCKSKRWDKLTDIFFPKDSCMHALPPPPSCIFGLVVRWVLFLYVVASCEIMRVQLWRVYLERKWGKKKGQGEIDRESSCDTLVKFEEFGVSTNHGQF